MSRIVPAIGSGTPEDPYRPDLPEGFTGTATLTEAGDYVLIADGPDPRLDAAATAARLIISPQITDGTLDNDTVASLSALYDPWRPGEAVEVGALRQWSGTLVECLQAHTTQADWTPDATPALWRIYRDPDTPAEWVQPTGAHDAYGIGDRVTFDGQVWESLIDGNTWSPTDYPAGWQLVATN